MIKKAKEEERIIESRVLKEGVDKGIDERIEERVDERVDKGIDKRNLILDFISFVVLLYFFYEGIYLLVNFHSFGLWWVRAPILRLLPVWLRGLVPAAELAVCLQVLLPGRRKAALWLGVSLPVVYVVWVMSGFLFTNMIFWPLHGPWAHPTWMQKMVIAVAVAWLSLIGLFMQAGKGNGLKRLSNLLRNKPADASKAGSGEPVSV